jgi:hypothetical protein
MPFRIWDDPPRTDVRGQHAMKPCRKQQWALTLAKAAAMRPRTKDININFHHFRANAAAGTIDIQTIRSIDQPADMFTKLLKESVFALHRQAIIGWDHVPRGKDPPSRNATEHRHTFQQVCEGVQESHLR